MEGDIPKVFKLPESGCEVKSFRYFYGNEHKVTIEEVNIDWSASENENESEGIDDELKTKEQDYVNFHLRAEAANRYES